MSVFFAPRWFCNARSWVPEPEQWQHVLEQYVVDETEVQRIGRFNRGNGIVGRLNPDARYAVIGRLLFVRAACECLKVRPAEVAVGRTAEGKPYIARPSLKALGVPLNINVSHAGDYVTLAADASGDIIGVDVMPVELVPSTTDINESTVADFFGLLEGNFTEPEWAYIKSGPSKFVHSQLRRFFQCWTLKEAYIKAVGIGLGLDLQSVQFTVDGSTGQALCEVQGVGRRDWNFQLAMLDSRHVACVATGPPGDAIESFRATLVDPSQPKQRENTALGTFREMAVNELLEWWEAAVSS